MAADVVRMLDLLIKNEFEKRIRSHIALYTNSTFVLFLTTAVGFPLEESSGDVATAPTARALAEQSSGQEEQCDEFGILIIAIEFNSYVREDDLYDISKEWPDLTNGSNAVLESCYDPVFNDDEVIPVNQPNASGSIVIATLAGSILALYLLLLLLLLLLHQDASVLYLSI